MAHRAFEGKFKETRTPRSCLAGLHAPNGSNPGILPLRENNAPYMCIYIRNTVTIRWVVSTPWNIPLGSRSSGESDGLRTDLNNRRGVHHGSSSYYDIAKQVQLTFLKPRSTPQQICMPSWLRRSSRSKSFPTKSTLETLALASWITWTAGVVCLGADTIPKQTILTLW